MNEMMYVYLDLIDKSLSNIQSLVWIPQYDFKIPFQTQLSPYPRQPSMGPCCQSQRRDPQHDHVTMVRGALLDRSEQ